MPPAPAHSKTHAWILILSVWTLVMTIVIIGLLMSGGGKKDERTEAIAAACENGATNAINAAEAAETSSDDAENTEETICETPANPTYSGSNSNNMLPKLSYPYGWSATQHWSETSTFTAKPGYFFTCDECGGFDRESGLTVVGKPIAQAEETDPTKIQTAYTEASKAEDVEYTNIVINSKTLSNGTAVFIDGHAKIDAAGEGEYDFHEVRFKTANTYVKVEFIDMGDATLGDEWAAVKASLDFSSVK